MAEAVECADHLGIGHGPVAAFLGRGRGVAVDIAVPGAALLVCEAGPGLRRAVAAEIFRSGAGARAFASPTTAVAMCFVASWRPTLMVMIFAWRWKAVHDPVVNPASVCPRRARNRRPRRSCWREFEPVTRWPYVERVPVQQVERPRWFRRRECCGVRRRRRGLPGARILHAAACNDDGLVGHAEEISRCLHLLRVG